MCDGIILHNGNTGTELETQGDLAKVLGGGVSRIIYSDGYKPEFNADTCLCPVDIEATALKHGFKCDRLDEDYKFDAFSYHWRKP